MLNSHLLSFYLAGLANPTYIPHCALLSNSQRFLGLVSPVLILILILFFVVDIFIIMELLSPQVCVVSFSLLFIAMENDAVRTNHEVF